jgi:hypothetical protein
LDLSKLKQGLISWRMWMMKRSPACELDPIMVLFTKLMRLSWRDRLLFVRAIVWLTLAGLTLTVLPFRYVGLLAGRPTRQPRPSDQECLTQIRRARWAIITVARRMPWRAACFHQGLAAQFMLRRQGIPSVLYYGAAQDERGSLSAHVWVRDGDVDVIGGEVASQYAELATFPPQAVCDAKASLTN